MANICGPKTQEAMDAGTHFMLKNVQLITNKSIPKIKHGQFFMSLANNLRTRLFTTQANNVSKNKNGFKNEKITIRGFREFKDTKDSSQINDLHPLLTAVRKIAISSSECERSFSAMNNIVTSKRNAFNTGLHWFSLTASDLPFSCSNQIIMLKAGLKVAEDMQMK
ncbi:hypothetical protein ACI65C_004982 [Semiaphis heraclei]